MSGVVEVGDRIEAGAEVEIETGVDPAVLRAGPEIEMALTGVGMEYELALR